MQKFFLYSIAIVALVSCKQAEENKAEDTVANNKEEVNEPFQLYQMSEMASFMEEMYAEHQVLKEQILNGETPDSLSYNLLNLHTATMTDSSDYDERFKNMAKVFVEYEEKIVSDPANAKANYNQAVQLCISCHQLKCTGPIPRIKKLLIK